jgi:hypothetical protein
VCFHGGKAPTRRKLGAASLISFVMVPHPSQPQEFKLSIQIIGSHPEPTGPRWRSEYHPGFQCSGCTLVIVRVTVAPSLPAGPRPRHRKGPGRRRRAVTFTGMEPAEHVNSLPARIHLEFETTSGESLCRQLSAGSRLSCHGSGRVSRLYHPSRISRRSGDHHPHRLRSAAFPLCYKRPRNDPG